MEMREVKTKRGQPGAGQPHGTIHMKNLKGLFNQRFSSNRRQGEQADAEQHGSE